MAPWCGQTNVFERVPSHIPYDLTLAVGIREYADGRARVASTSTCWCDDPLFLLQLAPGDLGPVQSRSLENHDHACLRPAVDVAAGAVATSTLVVTLASLAPCP